MTNHEKFMKIAIAQANIAKQKDEVPIGCVIVKDGKVLAKSYNKRNATKRATAHAEILAIEKACKKIGDWRLSDCDMYVTLQPCLMCLGASYNARIGNIYFGAYDTHSKNLQLEDVNTLNHNINIVGGVLEEECSQLLTSYFKSKR